MNRMLVLLLIGFCVMAVAIGYGLIVGNFFAEVRILLKYPWVHLTLIDLYMGFLIFSGWIVFRERSMVTAIVWIILLLTLGNLASCAYAFIAARRAKGDWQAFWLGSRADEWRARHRQ